MSETPVRSFAHGSLTVRSSERGDPSSSLFAPPTPPYGGGANRERGRWGGQARSTEARSRANLQSLLEAKGAWNADGIARTARAGYCRTCGAVVLRGLDADRAALTAVADPEPINPLGEFLALSVGRRTFDLTWRGRYELNPREPGHIRSAPAQVSGKSTVVVEHLCGQVIPLEGRIEKEPDYVSDERTPF